MFFESSLIFHKTMPLFSFRFHSVKRFGKFWKVAPGDITSQHVLVFFEQIRLICFFVLVVVLFVSGGVAQC